MIAAPRIPVSTRSCFQAIHRVISSDAVAITHLPSWPRVAPRITPPAFWHHQRNNVHLHATHPRLDLGFGLAALRAMASAPDTASQPSGDRLTPHTVNSEFLRMCEEPMHQEQLHEDRSIMCMLVLNFQLPKATAKLWHRASFKVCADGGSNRLFDGLPAMLGVSEAEAAALRPKYLPQAIIGDLDSIRPDVRQFYLEHGVQVLDQSADQDTTDLMKCLTYLQGALRTSGAGAAEAEEAGARPAPPPGGAGGAPAAGPGSPALPEHQILVVGALGGRLDHTLSNLNALYQYPQLNIVLWGDGNLVRLLRPGTTHIRPCRSCEGPACGLVPLGGPAVVSSSGLHWDLENTLMQVSGLISTCNVMEADDIWVTTDRELLWMTEVK